MIEKEVFSFAGRKLNWDDDLSSMPLGDSRYRYDIVYPNGNNSVIENRRELTERFHRLPAGTNTCIGWCPDTENSAIIYAVCNSNNNHSIIRFGSDNTTEEISYAKQAWGFNTSYPITKMAVIGTGDDAMLFMNDNLNPQRLANIKKLLDNDYTILTAAEINLYKPSPSKKPIVEAVQLPNIRKSNILGKLFQFKYGYVYDTGQKSMPSHESDVIYDYSNETISGYFDVNTDLDITNAKNAITILMDVDYTNVSKIEIYAKVCDIGSGATGSWMLYDTIDVTDVTHTYVFYNDRQAAVPVDSLDYNQDEIPIKSGVAEIVANRIVLGQNNIGRDNVDIDITLSGVTSTLHENSDDISYETAIPNLGTTDIDIAYISGELNSVNVVIAKVINATTTPSVESYENYYYTYKGFSDNNVLVTHFVDNINQTTKYTDIVASKKTDGGSPYMLRITNSGDYSTTKYYMYTFTAPMLAKSVSIKENSTQNLAICYYDSFGRGGKCLIKDLNVKILPYSGSNYDGYYTNYIKYEINNPPPDWAAYFQFLRAESDIVNHFSVPILIKGYYGDTSDIEEDGMVTRVDVNAALDRWYGVNEFGSLGDFELKKGDRARVLAYINGSEATHLSGHPDKIMDVSVLGIDDDGKVLLPSFEGFPEHAYWGDVVPESSSRHIYLFEFYRPSSTIEAANKVYYEIGDILPISTDANGDKIHTATTVVGSNITAQNQEIDSDTPAIGVINFGDTYRFYYHFGARFMYTYIGGVPGYFLFPVFANIESVSASFGYSSRAISTGRANVSDEDAKNETVPSLVYGGFYKSGDLNYNDLNRFINNPIYMDETYGAITGLVYKGNTLEVYQEKKVSSKYINATVVTLADGSTQAAYSTDFFNDGSVSPFNIGCSHPLSMVTNTYATYFFDLYNSAWFRRSQDGLRNITFDDTPQGGKMKAYGIYLSKLIISAIAAGQTYYVRGAYDPVKEMYLFTYVNASTADDVTIGFHEPTNSWFSFYSFQHEMYAGLNNNRFFSFLSGTLYEHHISSAYVITGVIQFHFNKYPFSVKAYRFIETDSDQKWPPSSEWDITVNESATAYQHPDSYEWYNSEQASLLKELHFQYYENKFIAYFLRNVLNKKGVSVGKIGLANGDILRGEVISVKLRNTKSTINTLRFVAIGFENSR